MTRPLRAARAGFRTEGRCDVTHVIDGFLPQKAGGTQTQLLQLALAQRRVGDRADVLTLGDDCGSAEASELVGEVPVTRLPRRPVTAWTFESIYRDRSHDRLFREFLERRRPGCIHVHHLGDLSVSLVEVARRQGVPVVMWLSDFWLQCLRGQRFHPYRLEPCENRSTGECLRCLKPVWPTVRSRDLERWQETVTRTLDACDALLVPSAGHRRLLADWGFDEDRLEVVPYGLPEPVAGSTPDRTAPVRSIGYLGTLLPNKGVHVLVQAFNLLDRSDLTLDLYGESVRYHEIESYESTLHNLVAPGLDVRFHGRYEPEELEQRLAAIDLLVVPSLWWESYCLTAREGARAGLPVVVSDLGGLAEAVEEGLAIGFPPGDALALAEVLAGLLDDPDRRAAMARAGRRYARIEDSRRALESVYRRVTSGATP